MLLPAAAADADHSLGESTFASARVSEKAEAWPCPEPTTRLGGGRGQRRPVTNSRDAFPPMLGGMSRAETEPLTRRCSLTECAAAQCGGLQLATFEGLRRRKAAQRRGMVGGRPLHSAQALCSDADRRAAQRKLRAVLFISRTARPTRLFTLPNSNSSPHCKLDLNSKLEPTSGPHN